MKKVGLEQIRPDSILRVRCLVDGVAALARGRCEVGKMRHGNEKQKSTRAKVGYHSDRAMGERGQKLQNVVRRDSVVTAEGGKCT